MLAVVEYPRELEACVTLPNRRRLRIRALRPREEAPIRQLCGHLSARTRYLRFFSEMPAVPDSVISLLASVDYRRHLALVAEHDAGSGAEVVALASFAALDETSAEISLLVRDEWQRQRVGTELAGRILSAAEDRGFYRFVAHLLPENVPARRLLKKARIVSARVGGGVAELAFVRSEEADRATLA